MEFTVTKAEFIVHASVFRKGEASLTRDLEEALLQMLNEPLVGYSHRSVFRFMDGLECEIS